jgi:hypothetical protein
MEIDDPIELIAAQRRRVDELNDPVAGLEGVDALTVLRAIYRSRTVPLSVRMHAAQAALPFERPKLSAVLQTSVSGEDFGAALERARKRMAEGSKPKQIDAQPLPRPGLPKP